MIAGTRSSTCINNEGAVVALRINTHTGLSARKMQTTPTLDASQLRNRNFNDSLMASIIPFKTMIARLANCAIMLL